MKFAVAVVLFALALGAHSSVVPLAWPQAVVVQQPGSVSVQAAVKTVEVPSAVQLITSHPGVVSAVHPAVISAAHPPAAVQVVSAPAPAHAVVVAASPAAHSVVVAAPPAVVVAAPAHEGTYVAKTRGAVHVAPLPGHANSAASVNLEPAPGTH